MRFNFKLFFICGLVFLFSQVEAVASTVKVKNTSMMEVLSYIGAGINVRAADRTAVACDVWEGILTTPSINIDSGYNRTGRILVIWSVDVKGSISSHSTNLCYPAPAAGGVDGNVLTKVSVVGSAVVSDEASLVMPKNSGNNINITGSFVITPDDFGGTIPASITLNLQWSNRCSQQITATRRSLVVVVSRD